MQLRSQRCMHLEDAIENTNPSARVSSDRLACSQSRGRRLYQKADLSNANQPLLSSTLSPSSPANNSSKKTQSPSLSFHTSQLDMVIGREKEIDILNQSLLPWLSKRQNGSLYISGAPGTGKTATVTQVVQRLTDEKKCRSLFLNCMPMDSPRAVYTCILDSLKKYSNPTSTSASGQIESYLEAQLTKLSKRIPLVMVLDEIDQLASRCQTVLFTVFGWPENLKQAHLILIGIANALDLTERLLAGLQVRSLNPVHVAFSPYSMDQIVKIISARLFTASGDASKPTLDNMAVQFCARKVAAYSGDVRTALAICRRALELARLEARSPDETGLNATERSSTAVKNLTPLQLRIMSSPSVRLSLRQKHPPKLVEEAEEEKRFVPTIRHVSQAIREAQTGGGVAITGAGACNSASGGMPLHHKLVLAACLLLRRLKGLRETSMGQLFDVYTHICFQRGQLSPLEMSEFVSVCEMLESYGLVRLSAGARATTLSTPARTKRLSLLLDDRGVERSLDDNLLMSSILSIQTLP